MAPTKERPATKTIATNREARHEYFVLEALETGVELKGTEVKSLRAGGVNLKDSWVDIEDGELLVKGMHISPYDHGNMFNQDPMRVRRLLAHKSEIRWLHQQCKAPHNPEESSWSWGLDDQGTFLRPLQDSAH